MSLNSNTDARLQTAKLPSRTRLDTFPLESIFVSQEQIQRFELLRLAFFVLKLRKTHEQIASAVAEDLNELQKQELAFQRNLLQHAVFQQILALTGLDAREQAMQIISTCHTK